MKINIIILVDESQEKKAIFIERLKKFAKFSYTKLEGLFQAIIDAYNEDNSKKRKENLNIFLKNFLKSLSNKDELYLIDVDNLLVKNAINLTEEYGNIMVVYLNEIEGGERVRAINIQDVEEVENFIINHIAKKEG